MSTTIQVNEETAKLLKMYKEQHKLKTYDEVIKMLMVRGLGEYVKQFRGILCKKDMKFIMDDLRDKTDRY